MAGTGNPIGSTAFADFEYNVGVAVDNWTNSTDNTVLLRTISGVQREVPTLNGIVQQGQNAIQAIQDDFDAAQAGQFVADSEAAADRAETAADVAMTAGLVYPDVASGEAARVDGDYFWVVSANDSEVLELWLMGATNATDTGKRTVSYTGSYLFKGTLASGSLRDAEYGFMLVSSANTYSDLPTDWLSIRDGYLSTDFYDTEKRFAIQVLRYADNPNQIWVRKSDNFSSGTTGWVKISGTDSVATDQLKFRSVTRDKIAIKAIVEALIEDNEISRAKLKSEFLYSGSVLDGIDLNSAKLGDGTHIVLNTCTNIPSSISGSSIAEESNAGAWTIQRITSLDVPELSYWRIAAYGIPSFTEWTRSSGGASSFVDKTAFFLGDSITQNGDYPARVAARLGCTAVNGGIGGSRLAEHNPTYAPFSGYKIAQYINSGVYTELQQGADDLLANEGLNIQPQVDRIKNQDWNQVDYIIMFYGTNDYGGDVALGTNADTDPATLKGALNVAVQNILTAYPHIRIAFVGPMYRDRFFAGDGENSDDFTNTAGIKLVEYGDAIMDAANNNHHLPALDLYRTSGVNRYTADTYLVDGLHPKAPAGYQLLADKVASFMQSVY